MFLVKIATELTKKVTSTRLAKAEKKNVKAMKRLTKAKGNFDSSNFDLGATQAEVMIQLTKLNEVKANVEMKRAINARKQEKLTALLASIDD